MAKKGGLAFLIGAGLGALAGLLLAPKSGKENREWVAEKVGELQKRLKKVDIDEVKAYFAHASQESVQLYQDVREAVLTEAAQLYDKAGRLTQEDYSVAIEKAFMRFKKHLEKADAKLVPLRSHLKKQWEVLKDQFEVRR